MEVPHNKHTSEFLVVKTLREKFGRLYSMRSVLSLEKVPPLLERSISAATRLKSELSTDLQMESIPLKELIPLAEDIHVKTREASQNTDLDIREFLAISKASQSINGELLNSTSKLTEINKQIKSETKKLKEAENEPTYTDEEWQLHRDRSDNVSTENQARLEILLQNRKDIQTRV